MEGVVIARGQEPVDEVAKQFEIEERLQKKKNVPVEKNSRVDFKKLTPSFNPAISTSSPTSSYRPKLSCDNHQCSSFLDFVLPKNLFYL